MRHLLVRFKFTSNESQMYEKLLGVCKETVSAHKIRPLCLSVCLFSSIQSPLDN